jgi:rsbT antagonist protein RsbS
MNSSQARIILNKMSVAIIATIQTSLTKEVLEDFKAELLKSIETDFRPTLILDFSGLDMMDANEFSALQKVTLMASLMGVESYFVSLSPGIVSSLIQLDVNIDNINTALNAEEAVQIIEKNTKNGVGK